MHVIRDIINVGCHLRCYIERELLHKCIYLFVQFYIKLKFTCQN